MRWGWGWEAQGIMTQSEFEHYDANKNGKITKEEVPNFMPSQ